MSVQTNDEEKRDTYNALLNCRSDLAFLEKKRDAFEGDKDETEYEAMEFEIQELERRISEFEEELGIE
jgi:predicted  nucleic acid-binding Zn-ribbon protein